MDTAVQTRSTTRAQAPGSSRYAKCIEASKRVRWEIDRDVIRDRQFDLTRKFLPDGLSQMARFNLANPDERRFLSQIQGRTYANMFGLVERFVAAKMLDVTHNHALGDQTVMESLVRFTDEELKHQELFRRLEAMMAMDMPKGYTFLPPANDVANAVLAKCTWSVLALICHIELMTLEHYRQSIDRDAEVSELWKDVFLFHMREESQHAVLDELEWLREDAKLTPAQRDAAVGDLIDLVGAVDGLLQMQATADAGYFASVVPRRLDRKQADDLRESLLSAYRWQYIVSGVQNERFMKILTEVLTPAQMQRIVTALEPIMGKALAS